MVSIITVNYHCLDLVINSIRSVLAHTSDITNIEFIVVSNSLESELEINLLKSIDAQIEYIQLEENIGFGRANNTGFFHSNGEYLFFLNPDTEFVHDALTMMLEAIESIPNIGIIGPAILNEGKTYEASVNNFPSYTTLIHLAFPFLSFVLPNKNKFGNILPNKSGFVDVVQGSSMFMKRSLFDEVDGFTSNYFMYSEETDLCYKSAQKGYKTFYYKEANIQHTGGSTTKPHLLKMEIEKHRSKKIFLELNKRHLITFNRFAGVSGYLLRCFFCLITFRKNKLKQFASLLNWYVFSYK